MSNNRNRPRLEGRSSPEVPVLVDQLTEVMGANKSDVIETAVRLLAEVMGLPVPMSKLADKKQISNKIIARVKARALEHFDRTRSEYERARHEASSAGGVAKRENLRNDLSTT